MRRLSRKISEIRSWLASVRTPMDWPAAFVLALFRTRPTSGKTAWGLVGRYLFPQLTVHPKSLRGFSVSLNPASMSSFLIFEEIFLHGAYDLDRVAFTPDTVVDCGAFEGHFTLQARARIPVAKFVAFEPHPGNFTVMCANFERNHLDIDARCEAVSNQAGRMIFSGEGFGGHLGGGSNAETIGQVSVVNLCKVIAQLAPQRLLLKIDVEGEEVKILPVLVPILPATCAIFFEWHHGEAGFLQMERLLCNAGFVVDRCRTWVPPDQNVTFVDAFAQRLVEPD